MSFKAPNARAAAVQMARQRAALQAQKIRNEAVELAPVLKKPRMIDGALYSGGRLRQSITVQQRDADTYRVGSNVEYAPYVEFGTRHQAAQPFMRPALEKVRRA